MEEAGNLNNIIILVFSMFLFYSICNPFRLIPNYIF